VEGRTHQFALALFASVDLHLHGLDDCVIFGRVSALGHAEKLGSESAGRQQPDVAKVGREGILTLSCLDGRPLGATLEQETEGLSLV
jgi:hypothetical protein